MPIQWFPGHMHVTKKAITERLGLTDVVIELLDARLPGSSANPMLNFLSGAKPRLKVLNKQDLADPVVTQRWLAHYNAQPDTRAIALDASERAPAQQIVRACHVLAPNRGGMSKPMRVMICGVPNVGKSTLINTLKGKRQAKAADEAGVTREEQRIVLEDDFYLWDTPGMLWPRIIVDESGYNLAASGAVGRNAYDEEEVALELLAYLRQHYADAVQARFQLATPVADMRDDEVLEAIGRRRGALLPGGRINLQKAAEIVLTELRAGSIGRISLETPEEYAQWLAAARAREAERKARKDAQAAERKARRSGRRADDAGSA